MVRLIQNDGVPNGGELCARGLPYALGLYLEMRADTPTYRGKIIEGIHEALQAPEPTGYLDSERRVADARDLRDQAGLLLDLYQEDDDDEEDEDVFTTDTADARRANEGFDVLQAYLDQCEAQDYDLRAAIHESILSAA